MLEDFPILRATVKASSLRVSSEATGDVLKSGSEFCTDIESLLKKKS